MIISKIKKKFIPLDTFIDFCLYKFKHSYYQKKNYFGHKGDFVTAPHISSIFSEMLSIWILLFYKKINEPKEINILELGPGDGTMAYDILSSLKKFKFLECKINYYLFEKSISLKKTQKNKLSKYKNIHWISDLNKYNKNNSIIISNEFFDALPIKQFIKKNKVWFERFVHYNNKSNKLEFIELIAKKNFIKKIKKIYNLNINNFIEFPTVLENLINNISKILKRKNSIFLTIDYGENSELCNDTLQAIYKNKKSHILQNIGNSDITYQVNFYHLIKLFKKNKLQIIDFANQSKFLQNLGIKERFEMASKNLKNLELKQLTESVSRLLHPGQMGALFKVLIVCNKKIQII